MNAPESKEEYGEHYHSHIIEMYKLHTEMADRVSHRRGVMNNLYTTGNIWKRFYNKIYSGVYTVRGE